jgi:hypothetical protein
VKLWLLCIGIAFVASSCTSSYPYLIVTDNCNCERFTYREEGGRFEIDVSARYEVKERITSTIELVFRNKSRDTLSFRQASIKGTSANIQYLSNGRFQPMPFVQIVPGNNYEMTFSGSDTRLSGDPWLKIAGEKVVLEIRGLLLGGKTVMPIQLTLVPLNPKIAT